MFRFEKFVLKSSFLDREDVGHAFSTRLGGVSALPHTAEMNVGFGRGDSDEVVRENVGILCCAAGLSYGGVLVSPQYHTSIVRCVTKENSGEGITRENVSPSDAFVTDCPGVAVMVRTADCTPILIAGEKDDGSPVVGAAHAGWKGTVALIAGNLVEEAVRRGARRETIRAAIGPCIGKCHFEVKDDFIEAVISARGTDFASRHIEKRDGKRFADLVSMNVEILSAFGISQENTDIAGKCTACDVSLFHSHRMTGGVRGTMGNVIGIKEKTAF